MSEEIIDDNDGTSRRSVERSEKEKKKEGFFTDYFRTKCRHFSLCQGIRSSSSCDFVSMR